MTMSANKRWLPSRLAPQPSDCGIVLTVAKIRDSISDSKTERNGMVNSIGRLMLAVVWSLIAFPISTLAAEMKMFSTIGVQGAIEALLPQFERTTGHKAIITFGLAAPLSERIREGETADLLIATRAGIESLIKNGKIISGSDATIASSGIGIAVRTGEPKPDITTPEALKRALLAARSVGYGNPAAGGATGVQFAKVLDLLGITDEITAKAKYPPPGGFVGHLLVSGETDLAVQQIPELAFVSGIELVGPLPPELQATTVFAAGVPTNAEQPDAARNMIEFLRSPEATAVFKAKGFDSAR
jgi:molybdate transport system substrate-binding protein